MHPLTSFLSEKFPEAREDVRNLTVHKFKDLYDQYAKAIKGNRWYRESKRFKNAKKGLEQVKSVALRTMASCLATIKILETKGKTLTTEELRGIIFSMSTK